MLSIAERTLEKEIEMSSRNMRINPDIADAIRYYGTYIKSSDWINRSGVISLSINPKGINSVKDAWNNLEKERAWGAIYAAHYRDSKWRNTSVMKKQFYCHARLFYSSFKQPWNLEPHKTSIDPIRCN
ncbi:MAG: DUF2599 domain-containing protein [Lachnospirales bacterium]